MAAAKAAKEAREIELWNQFKEAVVALAKPILQAAYDNDEISREAFKAIMKRLADKVVSGYKKEGLPPPNHGQVPHDKMEGIEKLAHEYVRLSKSA